MLKHNDEGVLLPYQNDWADDKSPVKVCEKSRRVGLSWTEAADSAITAASRGKSGMDVWYIGYNKDMAREFIIDVAFWAKQLNKATEKIEEEVITDEGKDIQVYRIKFASGYRVTALSSRPSNLRGKQGKVIIDEAAFHDDLAGLMKAAIALLMWGGRVVVISTHNGDDNPFNEMINDIRAGKKKFSLHRITIDDALAGGLYRRICAKLGNKWSGEAEEKWRQDLVESYGDDANEELFVIPSQGSEVYLSRALVLSCMSPDIPVYRWQCKPGFAQLPESERVKITNEWLEDCLADSLAALDPNLPCYFGEDFGRTGDLTVITPLQQQKNITYRAPFIVELRNVPFKQQEQILFYVVDRLPRFMGGALDARGNGQYLAEVAMQRYSQCRIQEVMLTNKWYQENMPKYKAAFEDKTILLPRDADILQDHRSVKMTKGIAKVPENIRFKGSDGGQRHGDAAISGAMAIFAAENGGPPAADVGQDPDRNFYHQERPSILWV